MPHAVVKAMGMHEGVMTCMPRLRSASVSCRAYWRQSKCSLKLTCTVKKSRNTRIQSINFFKKGGYETIPLSSVLGFPAGGKQQQLQPCCRYFVKHSIHPTLHSSKHVITVWEKLLLSPSVYSPHPFSFSSSSNTEEMGLLSHCLFWLCIQIKLFELSF